MNIQEEKHMVSVIEQIEAKFDRLQKARQIVQQQGVHVMLGVDEHTAGTFGGRPRTCFAVDSSTGSGKYFVNGHCSCPDAKERADLHEGWCKHRLAVQLWLTCDARTRRGESVPKEW